MKLSPITVACFIFPLATIAQNNSEEKEAASHYYEKGNSFRTSQKDSSLYYFDKSFQLFYETESYSDALDAVLGSMVTSSAFYDLESYRFYLGHIETLLKEDAIRSTFSAEEIDYYENRLLYNEASYLFKLKDYIGSKSKSLELRKKFLKSDIASLNEYELTYLVYSTHKLALIAMNTGKYDLAENYFNQALGYSDKNGIGKKRGLDRGTKRLFSQLYILKGENEKADAFLTELLIKYKALYNDDKKYKNSLVTVYQRMVNNLVEQDSLEKAIQYLDDSQKILLDDDPFYKESLLLYGTIYLNLNQDQKALDYYKNALEFFKEYRQNKPHQDIAAVHGKIAELYRKQKKFNEGLTSVKEAFETAGNNIEIIDVTQNPNPNEVFSKTQLLQLLDIKLRLLQGDFEQTGEIHKQESVFKTSVAILKTFDQLKSEFDSKLDKQFLAEKAYPIFQRMLAVTHTAYKNDPSSKTIELALNIAEKNKDFVLLEALRSTQANQYGNVPQKVLEKEAQLRAEITYIEKEIFDATEDGSGFSDDLFKRKQEYYSFLDTIKANYPKYHELKYQSTSLDLPTVREKVLEANGTLVSYTMTDEHLYAIVLNGSKEKFLKLPFSDADRESIREFYRVLSSPSIDDSQRPIYVLGKNLYDKILKKPLEGLAAKNLTIIPDGELHYLPFDLLQENGSYLLQTKNIGYGNSLASLLELKNKASADQNRLLAFAPMFDNAIVEESPEEQTRQLGKLSYNDDEVNGIETLYDADIFMGDRATLTNFKMNALMFNIIHLATHASANDEYPDYSYLAFTDTQDSTEGNILYIKDLYNTTLNADMVTLSACQTGIGKLQKGQGMLSLSKGFYYAGAKSLVNTLWKINDKSTVKLMEYFYQGLGEGKSKTGALRDAKLKYLETTDDDLLRHPYYWAAFVVSGDVSPITETHYWWYISAGAAFFMVLFFLSKRKGSKAKEFRRFVLRTSS